MSRALESVGAAVELGGSGEAFFVVDGLRSIYGGSSRGVLAVARQAVGERWAIATGSTRFAAFLAAGKWSRPVPVEALRTRLGAEERQARELIEALERLGVSTLKAFARLGDDQVADRFGSLGLRALSLCRGEEEPLRPRIPHEELAEEIELPEGTAGRQLDRALELLVDRLLASPRRKGRTLLGLRLGARLASGGSWSVEQGLGRPRAGRPVLRNVLAPRIE
jgi:protein ImuB